MLWTNITVSVYVPEENIMCVLQRLCAPVTNNCQDLEDVGKDSYHHVSKVKEYDCNSFALRWSADVLRDVGKLEFW